MRGFSGKGNGCQNVHDQVDPQKLHRCEWAHAKGSRADKNDNDTRDIDSQLELDELADVIEYVATPFRSSEDTLEVIIKDNQV
jgi:hypothetical protein